MPSMPKSHREDNNEENRLTSPCLTPNLRGFLIFSGRNGKHTSKKGHISFGLIAVGSAGPGKIE